MDAAAPQPAGSPPGAEPPTAAAGWRLPPFYRFLLLRLLATIPVLFGVTFICFGILHLAPGDPVKIAMGQRYDPEIADGLRRKWGLDKPFLVQYGLFVTRVAQGDLGRSYIKNTEIRPYLERRFRNTLLLTLVAMSIAVVVGVLAGIFSAWRPRSLADYLIMFGAVAGISMPVFWLGLMLQLLFASRLHWLPVADMSYAGDLERLWAESSSYLSYAWNSSWRYYVLPGLTLATVPMAVIARLTRSSMLEVMGQDYIRTARAKGMPEGRVVFVHALRNALIPVVTVIGNNFAALLAGAVLTETVFSWPGMGRAMVEAIEQYDYPVVLGGVMFTAVVFIIVNLLVDIAYGLIDPRVRYS